LLSAIYLVSRELIVSIGSIDSALVYPINASHFAVRLNAAAVILVHNHPSGDAQPFREDKLITTRIRQAGSLLGIEVLDHIIMARAGSVSLREQGSFAAS
jgi:DNA repair protein RadC